MFTTYHAEQVMTSDGNIYYLQYASFINKNIMYESVKKLNDYIIKENDNKYYVYVGASTLLENANKLQKMLENEGIYAYIKNDYIGDSNLLNQISRLDQEIMEEDDEMIILDKNKEILEILK